MLLDKYHDYVDVGSVTEPEITKLVYEFCKANPDKKPISAIDKFIREAPKVAAAKADALDVWQHKSAAPASMNSADPSAAARSADDMKWINQCVRDNKDEGAKAEVVLKYCTCMTDKMDENETRSISQWEKTHVAERKACDREAGWK